MGISACSHYQVTVQGINLDHLAASRKAPQPDRLRDAEAAYHNDLGVLLEREGDLEGALEHYKTAQKKDPKLNVAYINAGNVCVKLNNLAGAVYYYCTALDLEPDHPQALNNLAWVYILQGENLLSAISLLEKAIATDPHHRYRYLDSLGWAHYRNDNQEEAIAVLQSALEQTPLEETYLLGETHYHLGLIYHSQENHELSRAHMEKSLELNPSPEREQEVRSLLDEISRD